MTLHTGSWGHEQLVGIVVFQSLCHVLLFVTPWTAAWERLFCPSLSPQVCSNSCPLNWWCHPTISSSASPFSSCPPSCPASVSFPMSWLFRSSSQSIGVSASVLPMNIQDWFPLGLTGLISLKSKRLSRVFSSTTVQKHQSAEELMLFGINASFFFIDRGMAVIYRIKFLYCKNVLVSVARESDSVISMYTNVFFFRLFSIISYYKILSIVPYAMQWVFIVYLFYI